MTKPHIFLLLAPVPALLLGVVLMTRIPVEKYIWIQQLGALLVAISICAVLIIPRRVSLSNRSRAILLSVIIASLFFPALTGKSQDVERWIEFANWKLYIAGLVLPTAIYFMSGLWDQLKLVVGILSIVTALALVFQSDAAQVTALSAALLMALRWRDSSRLRSIITTLLIIIFVIWAWLKPDNLLPVLHVEGILGYAWDLNPIIAIISSAVLLLPVLSLFFAIRALKQPLLYSVVVYYVAIYLIAVTTQLTPIPFLGFGVAPIFGYYLLICFIIADGVSPNVVPRPLRKTLSTR